MGLEPERQAQRKAWAENLHVLVSTPLYRAVVGDVCSFASHGFKDAIT